MRHPGMISIALVLLATPTVAGAAPTPRLVCAIVDVYDCSSGECTNVQSEVVGVPDLVRLDGSGKKMTALDPEFAGLTTTFESMKDEGTKTTARAREGDRSLVLEVDDESGDARLTVSDAKLALVAYGECSRAAE